MTKKLGLLLLLRWSRVWVQEDALLLLKRAVLLSRRFNDNNSDEDDGYDDDKGEEEDDDDDDNDDDEGTDICLITLRTQPHGTAICFTIQHPPPHVGLGFMY